MTHGRPGSSPLPDPPRRTPPRSVGGRIAGGTVLAGLTALLATVTAALSGAPAPSGVQGAAADPERSPCPVSGASPARRGAEPTVDPDVRDLLRRAEARYDSLSTLEAHFTQTIEMRVFEPPRRKEGSGTWYQKGEGRFRMDFRAPEGDLIVADGRHVWLYYPSSQPGQVVRAELAGAGRGSEMVDLQGHIFEEARTAYRPGYAGREEVEGRTAHLVTLAPPEGSPYRVVRVWIDTSTLLVRRLQFEDQSETVRTITLSDLRPGVALPDSLFRFDPPAGVEVFEG